MATSSGFSALLGSSWIGPSFAHSRAHPRGILCDIHLGRWSPPPPFLSYHTGHSRSACSWSRTFPLPPSLVLLTAVCGRWDKHSWPVSWARKLRPRESGCSRADSSMVSTHLLHPYSRPHCESTATGFFSPASEYLTENNQKLSFLFLFRSMVYHTWISVCFLKLPSLIVAYLVVIFCL